MEVFYSDFSKIIGFNYKNKKKPYYLIKSAFFIVDCLNKAQPFKIDAGFESDGTTLYKIFWLLLGCPHTSEYLPGAIIHDWIINHPEIVNYDRRTSSIIFYKVLRKERVVLWKAVLMFLGVELGQSVKNLFVRKWK